MSKYESLEEINKLWNDQDIKLGDKIQKVSSAFYSEGLDLASTSAYIKATPSELDSFLRLGEFDDDIIQLISEVNPPKTTWTMIGNASDEEVKQALNALNQGELKKLENHEHYTFSEFVYQKMQEIAGPTPQQIIGSLSGDEIKHVLKKAEDFGALDAFGKKFLTDIARRKKRGSTFTDKQINKLVEIITFVVDKGVITRNSIDGDEELCDKILDALGK